MRPSARIPRVRRVLLSLLAVTALGATTTATAPAQQPPGAQEQPGHQVGRIDPAALPDLPAPTTTRPVRAASGEHCEPTRSGSRERRAGAVEACVSIGPAEPRPTGRRALAATPSTTPAAAAGDSASCAVTAPGVWNYSRFGYCVRGLTVLYVLRDGNGKQLGTGTLDVATSAILPADIKNPKWNEYVTVTMTGATGAVTSLTAKMRSACSAGCKASKSAPWYGGELVTGQSVNGFATYQSSPAPGAKAEFTTSYKLYVTSPGAQITDPNASWSNPEPIRCDDDVRDTTGTTGTPGRGCVVPSVTPVVKLSAASASGSAAAGYLWAQANLADGWGRDKLLTRAKTGTADRTSRTCGSGGSEPFQARTDLVANDSCGQFPFASTHEGGTDGARCAEIVPNYSSGGWDIYKLNGEDLGRPCARVHAPLPHVQAAEALLFEGFANQRVVEAEPFAVQIAASAAQPQAACLKSAPTGALPSGDGWISNTTEAVAHSNKTTTPPGPPGERATTAQACIGKTPGSGSDAEGDITGWQDAQIFRDHHTPKVGLARCHLIANILGGKGLVRDDGVRNLVPCWQSGMNTGTPSMRTYEFAAQTAVANKAFGPNDAILYRVTPDYRDAASTIPQGVTMSATVQRADGTSQPLFPEVYVTNTQRNTGKYNLGN
ncbi:DNA/RNA non-specific endonuclease [Streptomyces sp. C10-9-1]|uniref:DNA/RNA non-specific endonuclease n=1 Tax=Streptomyces sp. C10-9-1 TaxID=1859285 RepID=UPI002111B723|nr:DNA/RNA non-specific endonuclease [Streptomyces sp. C10-9-1]MCQ6554952.1 DNA/RNA non-specific endonuclease [Streptomyces sp. C10-9-1]